MKRLIILIFLFSVLSAGFLVYYKAGILPVNKDDKTTKIFVIRRGESLNNIIKSLADQGLIRNRIVFFLLVKKMGIEKKIQAGDFRLSPSMSAEEIAKNLTHGTLDVWLTIIEGMRKEEVARLVSLNLDIPESEFLKYAKEGYLFPDTYLIPKDATAVAVIKILEENFHKKFTDDLKNEALRKGLSLEEVLILASLVEREAKFSADRQKVASVLLKRWRNDWPLDVDATLQYAFGYQPEQKTWWKLNLFDEDKKIDSPYNTYKYKGLPPGPIANPGLASIKAVIDADLNTPYWYYVSDKDGHLHFGKTLEEHNENIRKYIK